MKPATIKSLEAHFSTLASALRVKVRDEKCIRELCPSLGGVYAIWNGVKSGKPIYVGETTHLKHRIAELSAYGRHAFFVSFIRERGIPSVPPSKSSHSAWSRLTISWLPLELGRAELEDFLVGILEPKYNSNPVRLRLRQDRSDFARRPNPSLQGTLRDKAAQRP
jgi:hypothetical protein